MPAMIGIETGNEQRMRLCWRKQKNSEVVSNVSTVPLKKEHSFRQYAPFARNLEVSTQIRIVRSTLHFRLNSIPAA